MNEMTIEYLSVQDLHPYANNPRNNDEAVEYVANSIREFGFKVPIIIDKDNVIVAGHTRLKAAERLGLTEVPCIRADDLTEEQVKAFRLADNKVGEVATWDEDKLKIELDALNISMAEFGFDQIEQEDFEITEDEFDFTETEDAPEPKSKRGEIYILGDHRLMVGDSTEPEDVWRLMGDTEEVDLVVTDPPYNVNISDVEGKTIVNDNMSHEKFHEFLLSAFTNMQECLKAGGAFYVWYGVLEHINFESALIEAGLDVHQQLVWVKGQHGLTRSDYQWQHEDCLYGWKKGKGHYFIDDRTLSTVIETAKKDIDAMSREEAIALLKKITEETNTTVIREAKPQKADLHPTMKPVPLIKRLVYNSSEKGETVLDLFGGSGTTLIACEELGRRCLMMEYDPRYADAIIQRWEEQTGKTAVKWEE